MSIRLPAIPGDDFAATPRNRYRLAARREPYPPKPDWFLNSLGEWVVYWYLSQGREQVGNGANFRRVSEGQPPIQANSFFYQIRLEALGLFALTATTRIDFYLPGLGGPGYRGLVLDPYNEAVHGGFGVGNEGLALDLAKRQVLAEQAQARLIWLHSSRLDAGDFETIEQALAGHDLSPRGMLGI